MKILYLTDIHGNTESVKKAFFVARKEKISDIIIGGDIAINPPGIRLYKRTQTAYVMQLIQMIKDEKGPINVFMMPGNDDVKEVLDILNDAQERGIIKQMHNSVHTIGDTKIAGYSFVNTTPFFLKDWDKKEKEIYNDLKCLPKADIYAFHAPPFGTSLDVLLSGEHIGSTAVRKFIEKTQPRLTLHGHIHESPQVTGEVIDRIGKTVCVNQGSSRDELNAAIIDLKKLKIKLARG